MLELLPSASLVGFEAFRLAQSREVWRRKDVAGEHLQQHAYCLPLPGDPSTRWLRETAVFHAERYGGEGLQYNGGGARCGARGQVQVKGIGRNCLAGSRTSFWHAYGGETIAGGMREAIWSEIINFSLPYGGVRVLGLLDTNTRVPVFVAQNAAAPGSAARGLTIREAALRPAHFMRAVYFSREDQLAHRLLHDARRTADAVGQLHNCLKAVYADQAPGQAGGLGACLGQMFERFALQLAAAQARHIVHGTLNASNICLDGRWIDYGTISTVSDYGRIITGAAPQDRWSHSRIEHIARDLVFHLIANLPVSQRRDVPSAATLYTRFRTRYQLRLRLEMLKLTGIPEADIGALPAAAGERLYACMEAIIRSGNREPFKLFGSHGQAEMPDTMGKYHLNSILRIAACSVDADHCSALLVQALPDPALRSAFVAAYADFRESDRAGTPGGRAPGRLLFVCVNSLRRNTLLPGLYRHVLDMRIEQLLDTDADLAAFIDTTIADARTVLSEPSADGIDLAAWSSLAWRLCPRRGALLGGVPVSVGRFLDSLEDRAVGVEQKKRIGELCLSTTWE